MKRTRQQAEAIMQKDARHQAILITSDYIQEALYQVQDARESAHELHDFDKWRTLRDIVTALQHGETDTPGISDKERVVAGLLFDFFNEEWEEAREGRIQMLMDGAYSQFEADDSEETPGDTNQ